MAVGFYELTGKLTPLDKRDKGVCPTFLSQAGVVVKLNEPAPAVSHTVANEYVCAELAKHIRLPIPPHFLARIKRTEEPAFCSLNASVKGVKFPPIDAGRAAIDEPDLCTGVLLFDIWVGNDDRHAKNIAYQAERLPHKLTIFDHSHAPFFYPDFATRNRYSLGIVREDGRRHCLLDFLRTPDYFDKWVSRIKGVSNEYIGEILKDAVELGFPEACRLKGYDFLCHRRDRLEILLRNHRDQFSAIVEWGLLWGT